MFRHYFLIAFRSLLRQKSFTAINILGLSLGVACAIAIFLYIQHELSYDRHHRQADRIYRLTEVILPAEHSSSQPFSVAPTIADEYPAMIEHAVRFFNMQAPTLTIDRGIDLRFNEPRFFFVDSTVFDVFTLPLIQGDPATALDEPYSVVITKPIAEKYFGAEDPMGKTLRFEGAHDLKVTGVFASMPKNSHLQFDFLASFSTVTGIQDGRKPEGWNWNPCWTYLLLTPGTQPDPLTVRLPEFVTKFFPDNIRDRTSLHLQPLTDIHLHSHLDYEIQPNSDITYIYIFAAIAAFVLLIACINYMNLATARASRRAREVGVRKVLGAARALLIRQFLGESFIVSMLAVVLALPLVNFGLPVLNTFLDKSISMDISGNPLLIVTLIGITLFVGFFAGLYPAIVLTAFRPVQTLSNRIVHDKIDITVFVRKVLVVLQFVISVGLIIGTLVVQKQLRYVQQSNLGFTKEQVVMVNMFRTNIASRYDDIKNRLLAHPNVLQVTTSEDVLGSKCQTNPFKPEGSTEFQQFQRLMVGYDFVETFELELVAGRSFQKAFPTDDSLSIVINESMVQHLGWENPQEALGKGLSGSRQTQMVIGVLKDFHYNSLHAPVGPFVLDIADTERQHNFFDRYLAVRISPTDLQETIAHLKKEWETFLPDRSFEYFFMEDEIDKLYRAEVRLSRIAGGFTALALIVACIGLLGIAAYMIETRKKEIGIRKILGASISQIFSLLTKEFLKPVLLANLLAWPLSWFVLTQWLEHFAYRTTIPWWIFLAAACVATTVAFLTIGLHILQTASVNPVDRLRDST